MHAQVDAKQVETATDLAPRAREIAWRTTVDLLDLQSGCEGPGERAARYERASRGMSTLAGIAETMGLVHAAELARGMEAVVVARRRSKAPLGPVDVDGLLRGLDAFLVRLHAASGTGLDSPGDSGDANPASQDVWELIDLASADVRDDEGSGVMDVADLLVGLGAAGIGAPEDDATTIATVRTVESLVRTGANPGEVRAALVALADWGGRCRRSAATEFAGNGMRLRVVRIVSCLVGFPALLHADTVMSGEAGLTPDGRYLSWAKGNVPVVDLGLRLGLRDPLGPRECRCFSVLRDGERSVALAVDADHGTAPAVVCPLADGADPTGVYEGAARLDTGEIALVLSAAVLFA